MIVWKIYLYLCQGEVGVGVTDLYNLEDIGLATYLKFA